MFSCHFNRTVFLQPYLPYRIYKYTVTDTVKSLYGKSAVKNTVEFTVTNNINMDRT